MTNEKEYSKVSKNGEEERIQAGYRSTFCFTRSWSQAPRTHWTELKLLRTTVAHRKPHSSRTSCAHSPFRPPSRSAPRPRTLSSRGQSPISTIFNNFHNFHNKDKTRRQPVCQEPTNVTACQPLAFKDISYLNALVEAHDGLEEVDILRAAVVLDQFAVDDRQDIAQREHHLSVVQWEWLLRESTQCEPIGDRDDKLKYKQVTYDRRRDESAEHGPLVPLVDRRSERLVQRIARVVLAVLLDGLMERA